MKYVQRRANRFEFRFRLPDDLAGRPAPTARPEALALLIDERTGRFKTEVIQSLKTTDARAAERKALGHIAEAHSIVDLARQLLAASPPTTPSADEIASLVREHEIQILAADERLRGDGLGLTLDHTELAPDGQGMTDLDLKAYEFLIEHLDGELRQQAATMRVSTETRSKAEAALTGQGIALEASDPARRKFELGLVAARLRALDGIKARLRGDLVAAPEPRVETRGIMLTAALGRITLSSARILLTVCGLRAA
jgi:hypothetical protein